MTKVILFSIGAIASFYTLFATVFGVRSFLEGITPPWVCMPTMLLVGLLFGNLTVLCVDKAIDANHDRALEKKEFEMNKPELNPGEHYAGIILGKDGEAYYHLILLPGTAKGIAWADAKEWAAEQGGELPTRREQSLLFANLKEQLKPSWHWSCETHAGDARYAWIQGFGYGNQSLNHKDSEFCALAVRMEEVK